MRILVTASREWTDKGPIVLALHELYCDWVPTAGDDNEFVVVHGDARGGDKIADEWATEMHKKDPRVRPEAHPVSSEEWQIYGKGAGHRRNATMVKRGADKCLAFPIGESKGTRGCLRQAEKAKIPTKVTEG